jgi:hypothetical protein
MYDDIARDMRCGLMPIYTFATLNVVGEESRPQSSFSPTSLTSNNGWPILALNLQHSGIREAYEAWEAYSGPSDPTPRLHKKPPVALAIFARIEDPAIRSIMEGVIIERDKLLKENNLLRTLPRGIIDKRPLGATIAYTEDAQSVAVLNIGARLTESERSALRKAVDVEVLADNGWVEGSHGEILNDRGRTLFDVGFATAIRKVLEDK